MAHMHSWSTFGVRMSHGQTRTHKTHHSLDMGEATTFPFIVYFVATHEAHIQMTFCSEIAKVRTHATLGPHNFACRFSIEMKFEAKL